MKLLRIIIAVFGLALAGCTVSEVPITGKKLETDQRLLGAWQAMLNEKMQTVIVTRGDDGALVAAPPFEEGVDPQSERLLLITARVGKHWYLSITAPDEPPGKAGYMLFRYEFRDRNRVVLFAANFDSLQAAIERKQIAGERVPDRHMESMMLKSNADELRAFIANHGPDIFNEALPDIDRIP
jgi:hypothetical protein